MLQLAAIMAVTSAIALLLGFMDFAVATAMGSVVLLCFAAISFVTTMLLVIAYTLAGRASYWFPPTG
jgi:hypothetical protein